MSKAIADFRNPLVQGLASAALHPGLRSILVFDVSPAGLRSAAEMLAQMLAVVTDTKVITASLGAVETEEELWGGLSLRQENSDRPFEWRAGLVGSRAEPALRVIVTPDLTRLGLAAARACVALMGTEVAHLERHGHQDRWRSNLCWIAGCDRAQVGALSPHLLDRFALRLQGKEVKQPDRADSLRTWLETVEQQPETTSPPLPIELSDRLLQARQHRPAITDAASRRVLDYLAISEEYSLRRDLALLRLAQTQAQLAGAIQVDVPQVDGAAQMIGLKLNSSALDMPPLAPPAEPKQPLTQPDSFQPEIPDQKNFERSNLPGSRTEVYQPDSRETLDSTSFEMGTTQTNPYPEDTAIVQRESASLRLPPRHFKPAALGRGEIIGVEPATLPQDIALVSTLLEAAKYRSVRPASQGLRLSPTDLRRYRRAAVPEQLLMLVLDHTCLRECQWQAALLPYLQWAYVERANVCLIQVGAANATQELQAEKVVAQNVLVPRISQGLEMGGGQATPLAHGLDLALQTLRHALQHGRSAVQQAVLVVISDGRGNVPLEASRANEKPMQPVNRQGIEDALQVAQQISGLKQVEAVVLNPQPKYYANLPVKLAQALGAKIAAIPSLKAWEVDK